MQGKPKSEVDETSQNYTKRKIDFSLTSHLINDLQL